jgi:catechol-2,3-dioxygenase
MNAQAPLSRAPVAFSHMGVFVRDLDRMMAFYTGCLGLVVSDTDTTKLGVRYAFLTGDPREHHQLVLATGRPEDVSFNTVQQISFRAESLEALRRMRRRVLKDGAVELGPVTHGNAISAYFRDPEGNRFELFIDTPWHVPQPFHVPLDIEMTEAELWTWVEGEARKRPGFRPRVEWSAEIARKLEAARAAI